MLYFFLSYARGDEDALVQQFFDDLCVEVRLQAGLSRHMPVGFIDRGIQVGQIWPKRLTDALSTCRSFLALVAPRYFQSEPCGKEWRAFWDRAGEYDRLHEVDSSLLKPLLWIPMAANRIHPVARTIQYRSPSLGNPYDELGIRQMMRLKRHEDDYRGFLFDLARQIVEDVENHPIPDSPSNLDYTQIQNAFRHQGGRASGSHDLADTSLTEPLTVHFIVVSSSRKEMSDLRRDLDYYGTNPADWSPYRPEHNIAIAKSACAIAERSKVIYQLATIRDLVQRAELARKHNQIIVLLLDAWMTRSELAKQLLSDYNARTVGGQSPTTAVLIPRSRSDPETGNQWQVLSRACRAILFQLSHDDELYRPAIPTHDLFELDLPEVLEVARNRVYSNGHVMRDVGAETGGLPVIDGPWKTRPRREEP